MRDTVPALYHISVLINHTITIHHVTLQYVWLSPSPLSHHHYHHSPLSQSLHYHHHYYHHHYYHHHYYHHHYYHHHYYHHHYYHHHHYHHHHCHYHNLRNFIKSPLFILLVAAGSVHEESCWQSVSLSPNTSIHVCIRLLPQEKQPNLHIWGKDNSTPLIVWLTDWSLLIPSGTFWLLLVSFSLISYHGLL